ncbi:DNA polymerase beta superfamily protein [Marinactinospora rubrisoli]|uniref:DNA polymerase beta superfamily protein n=1 Tax=Marinactinospora rubrisoli TaxID=2715399 RepID=A0ABW2KK33_9ACTN
MRHSTDEFARLAERGTILRCQVGSGVHGTAISGQDDRDEMGICVEPPEYVAGLRRFEQYIFRTAGEGRRSGPGDLDLVVYALRKWMRLALAGNPTVLLPLYVPEAEITHCTDLGRELRAEGHRFVSRDAARRFRGYLRSQRGGLTGENTRHVNRPELVAAYGFDTKYAYHMVRLGVQGVGLLETGHMPVPVPEPWRTWLRDLRQGRHTREEALEAAADLEARLTELSESPDLPERADSTWANAWLVTAHERTWQEWAAAAA